MKLKTDDKGFEISLLMVNQTFKIDSTKQVNTFTFGVNNTNFAGEEILSKFGESEIIKRLLCKDGLYRQIFQSTGILYPSCWIGVELKKEQLIETWPYTLSRRVHRPIFFIEDQYYAFAELMMKYNVTC